MKIDEIISRIAPPDAKIECLSREKWDTVAKPLSALGVLEEIITQIAACEGKIVPDIEKKAVAVFCADNGVVAEGVTQTSADVSAVVARNMCAGEASVCKMAAVADCAVRVIDIGLREKIGDERITDANIRRGTRNFAREAALTRGEVVRAIEAGAKIARDLSREGFSLLAAGEMGIGNTTTSAAVTCALLGKSAAEVAGRGAGLDDAGFARKIAVIDAALREREFDAGDAVSVLAAVGGLDIAGMCGFYLGAAAERKCVLLDGFIAQTAALCASKIAPTVLEYLIATHEGSERGSKSVLDALEKKTFIRAGLHLGEGTGAVLAMPMIEMARRVYVEMSTFSEINVEAYKR